MTYELSEPIAEVRMDVKAWLETQDGECASNVIETTILLRRIGKGWQIKPVDGLQLLVKVSCENPRVVFNANGFHMWVDFASMVNTPEEARLITDDTVRVKD